MVTEYKGRIKDMTDKQRQLIRYIEDHGHRGRINRADTLLAVTSYDQHGQEYTDIIPATWQAVREWLGY